MRVGEVTPPQLHLQLKTTLRRFLARSMPRITGVIVLMTALTALIT
jgi:hypothetical protein